MLNRNLIVTNPAKKRKTAIINKLSFLVKLAVVVAKLIGSSDIEVLVDVTVQSSPIRISVSS